MLFLAVAGSLLRAGPAVVPPNVPILRKPESVAGCERKGTIEVNLTEVQSDVASIRSPEMRIRVANLGGNAILILPGRGSGSFFPGPGSVPNVVAAAVYACPATAPAAAPASSAKN